MDLLPERCRSSHREVARQPVGEAVRGQVGRLMKWSGQEKREGGTVDANRCKIAVAGSVDY